MDVITITCEPCDGSGYADAEARTGTCGTCNGSGDVTDPDFANERADDNREWERAVSGR